jgi:hypothetical protein
MQNFLTNKIVNAYVWIFGQETGAFEKKYHYLAAKIQLAGGDTWLGLIYEKAMDVATHAQTEYNKHLEQQKPR